MIGQTLARARGFVLLICGLKRAPALAVAFLVLALVGTQVHASELESRWPFPLVAAPQAERTDDPEIFGTIPVPIRTSPTSTRWSKLMLASIDQPALARLTERAQGLSPEEQAAVIQIAVNQSVRSGPATHHCSDDGYWAPASETLTRGMGDCIDVAIAKMEALRFLGFAETDLYLTTGRFRTGNGTDRDRETAALLVRIGERFWLMSENAEPIIEASSSQDAFTQFTPIITYGVGSTWVHGRLIGA